MAEIYIDKLVVPFQIKVLNYQPVSTFSERPVTHNQMSRMVSMDVFDLCKT